MVETAQQLMWKAFGSRAPEGKTGSLYAFEPADGRCATCAAKITSGVPFASRRGVRGVDNATFYGYPEFVRWGMHVCAGCAWLYGDPKRTGRGMLVVGESGWWPTISQVMDGRPRWRGVLREIAIADPRTPMTGVLTTDPKVRLWPKAMIASCGRPGLYLHSSDDNVSRWAEFSIGRIASVLMCVDWALAAGATKADVRRGLETSTKLVDRYGIGAVAKMESRLSNHRGSNEFIIAILVA